MLIEAVVPRSGRSVGCLDPMAVLLRLEEEFGADLESDRTDATVACYEQKVRSAAALVMPSDALPVQSAATVMRETGPRYEFRLRVGSAGTVTGSVDRYSVRVIFAAEDAFPEPTRSRFVAFLKTLRLGQVRVGITPDA